MSPLALSLPPLPPRVRLSCSRILRLPLRLYLLPYMAPLAVPTPFPDESAAGDPFGRRSLLRRSLCCGGAAHRHLRRRPPVLLFMHQRCLSWWLSDIRPGAG
ncbi:hypothetical protein GQ55_5G472300 [Panicum hallii var. hallii]|uniref:Uncharacterized protein n=1 Tax=Panicum hallii var. hallii TaxID=1504633 RepID=A0A2T7DQX9_9POAL|nr:hypothetical protein GQ55_5G472300 [Panicum hallii var. hallii]